MAGPATAGPVKPRLSLRPGGLSVRYQGQQRQAGQVTVRLLVSDARGSGAGWQLDAVAPFRLLALTVRCAPESSCTLPRLSLRPAGPLLLGAAPGSGMGRIIVLVATVRPLTAGQLHFQIR